MTLHIRTFVCVCVCVCVCACVCVCVCVEGGRSATGTSTSSPVGSWMRITTPLFSRPSAGSRLRSTSLKCTLLHPGLQLPRLDAGLPTAICPHDHYSLHSGGSQRGHLWPQVLICSQPCRPDPVHCYQEVPLLVACTATYV